jgi:hypothetical protein
MTYLGTVGIEYGITDQLLFVASASYRFAGVDELTVDSESTTMNGSPYPDFWEIDEGELLRWYSGEAGSFFTTERGDVIGLDFGGPQLTVSLAYAF